MKQEIITSKNNDAVKYFTSLSDKKVREQTGCFLLEGYRAVSEAVRARCVRKLFVSQHFSESPEFARITATHPELATVVFSDRLYQMVSDTKSPQGVAAVCKFIRHDLSNILHTERKILLLEDVRDPGNMGTIIRTAVAAGFQGIVVSGNCVDIYNAKVLRSTAGCIFKTKIVQCKGDLLDIAEEAAHIGFQLYAAHPRGGKDLFQTQFGDRIGIVIGNEANGVSTALLKKCGTLVTIRMAAGVESLNASVAAALMMYETVRG